MAQSLHYLHISHNKDVKQCNICIKKLIIEQMTLRMYYYFS